MTRNLYKPVIYRIWSCTILWYSNTGHNKRNSYNHGRTGHTSFWLMSDGPLK